MVNKTILTEKYRAMYRAMIAKDSVELNKLLDDSFLLVHMTGMRHNKQAFIQSVKNGTLNYFSEELHEAVAQEHGNNASFTGKSYVNAAVFGGGRHTWRLQLDMQFALVDGEWFITEAVASTW